MLIKLIIYIFYSIHIFICIVPKAKRICYSTCSIHITENESVVDRILEKHPEWTLNLAIPSWPRRGMQVEGNSEYQTVIQERAVRCLPEDQTNGFFVACFIRNEKE
jgi:putative methyltransferase